MPKPAEFTKPPADLGPCKDCRWWLASVAIACVKLPTGAVVSLEKYRASGLLIDGAVEFPQAPCTFMPQWVMQPDMGWCGQWNVCPPSRSLCPVCGTHPPGDGMQCLGSDRIPCPYNEIREPVRGQFDP